ncbi:hypothetical protein [Streptomyces sp. NPDC058861]|uniref:hypothetical protein n=1 Tax=Streptomyces sp. NPDC058861 TaxID=3346653 RepID=UPI0036A1A173
MPTPKRPVPEEFALLKPSYVHGTFDVDGTVRTVPGYTTTVVKNRTPAFIDKSRTCATRRGHSRTAG